MKRSLLALLLAGCWLPMTRADDAALREQAAQGLRKASQFFRTQVSTEGGYMWRYSEDLKVREGEGKATASVVWVQPPGTPSVGLAFLNAFELTGDAYYRDLARDATMALVRGQLRSGGWDYSIEFDPEKRKAFAYRVDKGNESAKKNVTTLDDNNTQAALRLLMRVDQTLGFKDAAIHEAVEYALSHLLKAQYPNGAWPQRFDQPPDAAKHPVKKADFPETWSRTWPAADYKGYYTLNDGTLSDMIDTMFEAARIYKDKKYRDAAEKGGGFLLLAQLPEPQPIWAQQYNADMHPSWARKFEPPSVTGGESQKALRTLMQIYRETGDRKYLEPLPKAIAFFKKVMLPNGQLARFYELKTSKPLYFTKDYQLVYTDNDLPTHYGFKVGSSIDAIAKEYETLKALDPAELKKPARPKQGQVSDAQRNQVKAVLAALDEKGRWVEDGKLRYQGEGDTTTRILDCQTFIKNVGVLSSFLAASKPK